MGKVVVNEEYVGKHLVKMVLEIRSRLENTGLWRSYEGVLILL